MFEDKTIFITGGTGSLGKKLVKYFLYNTSAKKIIIFSRDELKQYHLQHELESEDTSDRLRFFIGDVRDFSRLKRAVHGVDVIVHAAALKQVPAMEYNPLEAVKTNVYGTQNVIEAAVDEGVEKVLFISTDKATQPVNLYGATKMTAEKLITSANAYGAGATIFSAVRYGNVVGSRGSVIDLMLHGSRPDMIGITHPDMTRFWITLDKAVELVMFALENMEGGEIFIPKIPSMKLVDLFQAIAPGVERKVTGIRPGEKIHEDLMTISEARNSYELDRHYVVLPQFVFREGLYKKYATMGRRVPEQFAYSSNTNTEWLTVEQIKEMVRNIEIQ